VLFAWVAGSAGCFQAATTKACLVPSTADAAQLGIQELHEFGKNYEVFQLVVKLDGCLFFQTDDTAVLGRPQVDVEPKPVGSGSHDLELFTKFRSGPSADMHDYEWIEVQHVHLELASGSSKTLVIRRSEVLNRDPRKRMQTDTSLQ
jgi:hypothetical protein